MITTYKSTPSVEAKRELEALQAAVTKALDIKRKLGQHAVMWDGEKVIRIDGQSSSVK